MKKLKQRIICAWKCLFAYEHFIILNITREGLKASLQDAEYDITGYRCGLQNYNATKIIKAYADHYTESDMILMKAEFMAKAEIEMNISL